MKQKTNLRLSILAAALSLGLAATAAAQGTAASAPAPAAVETGAGMLGSGYTEVAWNYLNLDDGPPGVARGFSLAYNQPVKAGLDFNANYDWARASAYGVRLTQQRADLGVTAFSPLEWGKPYVQALAGWVWQKGGGFRDSSFAYTLGTGVEFQVAPRFTLTPYVNFVRATGFNSSEFDLGAKAAYRLSKEWSLTARAQYDAVQHSSDATEYSVGVAYHF
jgi:opacity protein-like surface antigen